MRRPSFAWTSPRAAWATFGVLAALSLGACKADPSTTTPTTDAGRDAGSGNVGADVGSACTSANQCDSRTTPACLTALKPLASIAGVDPAFADLGLVFPNGYCSNALTPYCVSDSECGTGGQCYRPFANVAAATLRDLEAPLGVSAGTLDFLPEFGVCFATCTATSDCATGQICDIPMKGFIGLVDGSVNDTPYCITVPGCESCDTNARCELDFDGAGSNRCACNTGYTGNGTTCTAVSGACATNPCQNGGTCSEAGASYTCACIGGYTGTNCEISPVVATVPIGGPCTADSQCAVTMASTVAPHCYTTGLSSMGDPLDIRPLYSVLTDAGITSPLRNVGLTFSNGYCSNIDSTVGNYCSSDIQCGAHGGCLAPFRNVTAQTLSDLAETLPPLPLDGLNFLPDYGVCLRRCIDSLDCIGGTNSCEVPMTELISMVPGSDNTRTYCVPHDDCEFCDNNAYCSVDAQGAGTCICRAGFTGNGLACVPNATPACADNPCQNGGTCTDGANQTYVCACPAGFTGTNCQIEIIPPGCSPSPCLNGGTCSGPLTGTTYTCSCPTGYSGVNCETYICSPNPCQNGGSCTPSGSTYSCSCQTGFTGPTCSTPVTCPAAVAPANGTVTGSSTSIGATITYACNSGYAMSGTATATCTSTSQTTAAWSSAAPTCTATASACASNPCQNGGTCTDTGGGNYTCACADGYGGTTCGTKANCGALTAPANGMVATAPDTLVGATATYTCNSTYTLVGSATRTCDGTGVGSAAWSGTPPSCMMMTADPCSPNPCLNGGTCSNSGGNASCACAAGYSGTTCQTPVTCSGATAPTNGTVSAATANYPNSVTYACNTGYTLSGTATRDCGSGGTWTTAAPTCTANACSPNLTAPANGTVSTTTGTTGTVATYACNSGYTLTGSSTTTCQSSGAWSNPAPTCVAATCGSYTDVIYAVTAGFRIGDTFLSQGNQTFTGLSANASTPSWGTNFGTGSASPFNRPPASGSTTFTRGFVRLRFTNNASGTPIAGTVRLVEWYVPMEFTQTKGATVNVNTDHSVGIINNTLSNCGGGDAACVNHTPGLNRTCAPNASGTLSGTTLTWGSCTPATSGAKSWNYTNGRAATGAGCATGWNAFGNANSTSSLVPDSGKGDSYQTWNQQLSTVTFSGTNYLTATITMPEFQVPNGTGQSTTWMRIISSTVIGTDCGSTVGTDLLCNVQ